MANFDQTIQEIERKYPSRKIEETVPVTDRTSSIVSGLNIFAYATFAASICMILVGIVNAIPIYVSVGVAGIPGGLMLKAASSIIVLLAEISDKLNK